MAPLEEGRKYKDEFFRSDPHSPLSDEQKRSFAGLAYFDENPELRFDVEVEPFAEHLRVQMQTSTGDMQDYIKYGTFRFEVDGDSAELTVYVSDDGDAFVPFADATSGSETYGAGRYLDLDYHGGDRFRVDFNQAYNPWCAYSPEYSCPIPPRENRLAVPIRAGEKDFGYSRTRRGADVSELYDLIIVGAGPSGFAPSLSSRMPGRTWDSRRSRARPKEVFRAR